MRERIFNWVKAHKVWSSIIGVLVLFIVIGIAAGTAHSTGSTAANQPPPTVSAPATQPAAPQTTSPPQQTDPNGEQCQVLDANGYCPGDSPPPPPPPANVVIAKFYGTGSGTTGAFTVPSDGNWHLSYEFTNGSLFAGQTENFIVTEKGTDGTYDQGLVNDLAIGNGTPTAVPVYSDTEAGNQVYFQVITDDASWELVVLTGSS